MRLRLLKVVVRVVLLEEDEDGNIIGERASEQPVVLYGGKAVREWLDRVEQDIAALSSATPSD